MKRIASAIIAAAFAASAFAGDISVDLSATGSANNVTKDVRTFAVTPEAKVTYNADLGDGMGLKAGATVNDAIKILPKDAGDYTAMALKIEPFAEFSLDGLTAKLSLPFYKGLMDKDKGGNLPRPLALNDKTIKYDDVLLAGVAKVSYKVQATDEISVTPAAEAGLYVVPAVRFDYVKPSVNVAYGTLVSLDLPLTVNKAETKINDVEYFFTTTPKVTVGLDDLGLEGFKVFTEAGFSIIHKDAKGLAAITPGVSGKIEDFSFEAKVGLGNLDKVAGNDMTVNPSLKLAYVLSF